MLRLDRPPLLAVLLLAGMAAPAHATNATSEVAAEAPAAPDTRRGWQVGEKIVYRIYWGYLPVGTATITSEWAEEDGRRMLLLRLRTVSNKVIEKIYPVDDVIESVIDPTTFLPVRFTKRLSEGRHRYHEVTTFDHANGVAHWQSLLSGRTKQFRIRADTRDIPAFMYWMRNRRFEVGSRQHFEVMADEKIYDLWVSTVAREKVKLPRYGAVPSLKIEPEAAFEGLFVRKGRIWVWVSDDDRRLATKIIASVPVANVRALVWSVEGPGDDFWVRARQEAGEQVTDDD